MNALYVVLLLLFPVFPSLLEARHKIRPPAGYINMHLGGRLGNQMFQVAAALSLAKDTGALPVFPEFRTKTKEDVPLNRQIFFSSLNTAQPADSPSLVYFEHPHFHYQPIPYRRNIEIYGYFQSEKYFKHNKQLICDFFEPSMEIRSYLETKYQDLLAHPCTVAIHMRAYKLESLEIEKCFPFLPGEYYMKAAELFPPGALFVIFSDRIDWAKEEMRDFSLPHVFIENEPHYHDLYLMSFCKHQIISPSSFSWWAAYLNKNPDKFVVAPNPWFSPISGHDSSSVIPEDWHLLDWMESAGVGCTQNL